MDDEREAQDAIVQLLRVLSEVDLDGIGDNLRDLDGATARRAMTGATMLAEALTRATLASQGVVDALGVELTESEPHEPYRSRGVRIDVHDDEAATALDPTSEA